MIGFTIGLLRSLVMFLHMSVILSTWGRGGLCMMSLPVWLPGAMFLLGVSVSGAMFLLGGLCLGGRGLYLGEGSLSRGWVSVWGRGLCPGGSLLPHMVKSGRHTSYWNDFLVFKSLKWCRIFPSWPL